MHKLMKLNILRIQGLILIIFQIQCMKTLAAHLITQRNIDKG